MSVKAIFLVLAILAFNSIVSANGGKYISDCRYDHQETLTFLCSNKPSGIGIFSVKKCEGDVKYTADRIRTIRFANCENPEFHSNIFKVHKGVTTFDASDVGLKSIAKGLFNDAANLKHLKLANNQLDQIPSFLFNEIKTVEELDLSSNKISDLSVFIDINNALKKLNLSKNKISTIGINSLKNLQKLEHLDLSRNSIENVENGAFSELNGLKTLDLSNNALTTLNADILPRSPNHLETLLIGNNKLKDLIGFSNKTTGSTKIDGLNSNSFDCAAFIVLQKQIALRGNLIPANCTTESKRAEKANELPKMHAKSTSKVSKNTTTKAPSVKSTVKTSSVESSAISSTTIGPNVTKVGQKDVTSESTVPNVPTTLSTLAVISKIDTTTELPITVKPESVTKSVEVFNPIETTLSSNDDDYKVFENSAPNTTPADSDTISEHNESDESNTLAYDDSTIEKAFQPEDSPEAAQLIAGFTSNIYSIAGGCGVIIVAVAMTVFWTISRRRSAERAFTSSRSRTMKPANRQNYNVSRYYDTPVIQRVPDLESVQSVDMFN